MSTEKKTTSERLLDVAGNLLPILTVVFFAMYYYFSTKFADVERVTTIENRIVVIEKDISLLQKEDISSGTKLTLIDDVENRLRECERRLNLLIGRDDKPILDQTTMELKSEITMLKSLIESMKQDLRKNQ
jgi:hypothetical protein